MNIEIINELKEYVKKGREILADAEAEYCSPYYGYFRTPKEKRKAEKILRKIRDFAERIDGIEENIEYYEKLGKEYEEKNEKLTNSRIKDADYIKYLEAQRDQKKAELKSFEQKLLVKYDDILSNVKPEKETPDAENDPEETEEQDRFEEDERKSSNKKLIAGGVSLVALIIALTLLINANSKKNNKQATTTNDTPIKSTEVIPSSTPMPTSTPELKLIEETLEQGFVDINDSEALKSRAEEIVADIVRNNPEYVISSEEVENMLLWINGGVVANPTQTDRDNVLHLYLDLLNRDAFDAKEQFDFTKLFLNGSRAQKAAQEAFEVRKDILTNLGTDKVNESADKLAELFAKSMNSLNGAQSFSTIETNMSKVVILLTNISSYNVADFDRAATYTDENGRIYDLTDMVVAANTNCVSVNGEEHETLDLFSSLLYGALSDAKDLAETNSLKLTK